MKFKDFIDSFRGVHVAKFGDKYVVRKVSYFGLLEKWYAWFPANAANASIVAINYDRDYREFSQQYNNCLFNTLEQAEMVAVFAQRQNPDIVPIDKY